MARASDRTEDGSVAGTWSTDLYNELRRLAATQVNRLHPGEVLQATALVHEAWLKLGINGSPWQSRAHFFGAASQAMRQILVDEARRRAARRNGGGMARVDLTESKLVGGAPDDQLLAVNDALERLAAQDPVKAELVSLRFSVGLTLAQAAKALGISEGTAKRHWTYARAWLYREIKGN